jgi:hypothetical protein
MDRLIYLLLFCVCYKRILIKVIISCIFSQTFLSQISLWNSGYSPRGEHGSDGVAPTQDIGGIGPFWWWRKPEYPEETTGTWPAPKIPIIRCNILSAASWDRTHTPHRHWLQACESDTSDAPWTARPPHTPMVIDRVVNKFIKTLAKLPSSWQFSLVKSENNWPKIQKGSVRGGKNLPDWRVGLNVYSPIQNSTRTRRVVIRTPVIDGFRLTGFYMGKNISPGTFAVMVSRAVDVPPPAGRRIKDAFLGLAQRRNRTVHPKVE